MFIAFLASPSHSQHTTAQATCQAVLWEDPDSDGADAVASRSAGSVSSSQLHASFLLSLAAGPWQCGHVFEFLPLQHECDNGTSLLVAASGRTKSEYRRTKRTCVSREQAAHAGQLLLCVHLAQFLSQLEPQFAHL